VGLAAALGAFTAPAWVALAAHAAWSIALGR